ncbi:MAG: hypothetical protein ABJB47_18930 [Actinomycetota bacterium]
MSHVTSPVLRRIRDEPLAVPDKARRHLADCGRCQTGSRKLAAGAALAAGLHAPPRPLAIDTDAEWDKLAARLREPAPARPRAARAPRRLPRRLATASVSTGTAVTVGVLVVGAAAAATLTTVYAPTHVATVPVTSTDLSTFQEIANLGSTLTGGADGSGPVQLPFGQLTWSPAGQARQVASVAQADAMTKLAYAAPSSLPQGVGRARGIMVQPQVTATIRFSQNAGHGVGGAVLTVRGGPAILVEYGGQSASAPGTLAIITMRRPVATSTGATAGQLEDFLLAQSGLPPVLAQEIRLLGGSALPVPVPSGVTARHLAIGGSPAVLLTGPAEAASGAVWESRDGIVHAVAGLLSGTDILNVARQLG